MGGVLADRRILLVDDQRFVRTIVNGILKQLGCTDVTMAEDGSAAIAKLAEEDFDAVICDIKMRPMNGLQLVKSIRSGLTGATYDLPIVMLTGHPEERFVKAAMELHVNAFCIKPVTSDSLGKKLIRAIVNPQQIESPIHSSNKAIDAASRLPDEKVTEGYIDRSADDIAKTKKSAQARIRKVPLSEVLPGHILATMIKTPDGVVLLHRGVTLTEEAIQSVAELTGPSRPEIVAIYE
jgi:YesN/AraC family two-component response regulator